MDNLQKYRNKKAQEVLKPGALDGKPAATVEAALKAADERLLARQIEPNEEVIASNGNPIPAGHYAIVERGDYGEIIIASDPAFFDSIWELDQPE